MGPDNRDELEVSFGFLHLRAKGIVPILCAFCILTFIALRLDPDALWWIVARTVKADD